MPRYKVHYTALSDDGQRMYRVQDGNKHRVDVMIDLGEGWEVVETPSSTALQMLRTSSTEEEERAAFVELVESREEWFAAGEWEPGK